MCHSYGKITTELVRFRAAVTIPIPRKGLYHWHIQTLTDWRMIGGPLEQARIFS
jgi:hypothetical protein